jgi:hypothetical protein
MGQVWEYEIIPTIYDIGGGPLHDTQLSQEWKMEGDELKIVPR